MRRRLIEDLKLVREQQQQQQQQVQQKRKQPNDNTSHLSSEYESFVTKKMKVTTREKQDYYVVSHIPPPVNIIGSSVGSSSTAASSITSANSSILSSTHFNSSSSTNSHQNLTYNSDHNNNTNNYEPQRKSSSSITQNKIRYEGTTDIAIANTKIDILFSNNKPLKQEERKVVPKRKLNPLIPSSSKSLLEFSLIGLPPQTTIEIPTTSITMIPKIQPIPTPPRKISFSETETAYCHNVAAPPQIHKTLKITNSVSNHMCRLMLLSRPSDSDILNPIHCFVRNQIEVFTVTATEISAKTPGRRRPIKLHQVGLRCIHCWHLPLKNRARRAVSYPSSISRVYHAVSDMKLDHFMNCKGFPEILRKEFNNLRSLSQSHSSTNNKNNKTTALDNTNNTGGHNVIQRRVEASTKRDQAYSSTAQYYKVSACELGMIDSDDNTIFLSDKAFDNMKFGNNSKYNSPQSKEKLSTVAGRRSSNIVPPIPSAVSAAALTTTEQQKQNKKKLKFQTMKTETTQMLASATINSCSQYYRHKKEAPIPNNCKVLKGEGDTKNFVPMATATTKTSDRNNVAHADVVRLLPKQQLGGPSNTILLSCPMLDHLTLPPIHCFVRKHIEIFVANKEDVNAPATGRKHRVYLGQVGIRCIHCANELTGWEVARPRVKRSVCYPPSVSGIYRAVSNMKLDHFGICHSLPRADREEFNKLKALSCHKRGRSIHNQHEGANISHATTSATSSSAVASGGGRGKRRIVANSVAQYYHDSAFRIGLVDTDRGIRYIPTTKHNPIDGNT